MQVVRWSIIFALLLSSRSASLAQAEQVDTIFRNLRIDARELRDGTTAVPGQGREVPGLDLDDIGTPRHIIGDDPAFAERAFVDSTWMPLGPLRDTVLRGGGVHWLRYYLEPAADLERTPLVLNVAAIAGTEVFLNGRSLVRLTAVRPMRHGSGLPSYDSLLCLSVPFVLLCDGKPEVLAVRIEGAAGEPLRNASLILSLRTADASYHMHRHMVHYGVFIGINVIILLLSLVIWRYDRADGSWLLLAALSVVSALDTFCEVGYGMGALGFTDVPWKVLGLVRAVLIPWPMYLLIMVLGRMRGDLSARRAKWYTRGVLVVTFICAAFGIGEWYGILGSEGLMLLNDGPALIIAVIVFALVFAVVVVWFAIDVVRLGIRLLRSKGYARWIGGGALASSLLTLVLRMMSAMTGVGLSSVLEVLADYCSYVAVPVSIAVYLAIRSGHHNRLVARQRDELDEEVKERTAQLSAEKDRSDELLLNILPAEVAEELKRTGAAAAKHFDLAAVLFTDFKGFTSLTERVGAAELLQELNTCFKAFDDIITARGIEKIKTIGDAYMCVGGLPDPKSSSPEDVVHAALEMQDFMKRRKIERDAQGQPAFEMRVGIHTGPVIAGIVGVKKFQYDIWGDTVNIASRMESSGEVGQVNISESTYESVKSGPGLTFTPRGKVQAKGKGEMEMYFVEARS
ncbi:MAG: adenylate/guanylate cyclase domain-containing protein [Flavobacteriales bacterium]|nr:adenylate/guanylate cyclase domain-containing protein [Flavobacteriales bacterium]